MKKGCIYLFVISGLLYIGTSTLLKSHNLNLNYEIQQLERENEEERIWIEQMKINLDSFEDRATAERSLTEDFIFNQDKIRYIERPVK